MGYDTRYSLTADLMIGSRSTKLYDNEPLQAAIKDLVTANAEAAYVLNEDGSSEEAGKWYEHEDEMKNFSREYPGILFTLHGEGEENEDVWNKYFLNGKVQVAKAKFQIAPFDIKKLK